MTSEETMPLKGVAAPPMANGEVTFDAPWQSRIFGMTRVLCELGQFEWNEFRACLISRIEAWEEIHQEEEYIYFDHFFLALTDVISEKGICSTAELQDKSAELNARPHGHDH